MGKNELTPEKAYKRQKRMGVAAIVFGVLVLLTGIILVVSKIMPLVSASVLFFYPVIMFAVGIFSLVTAKKKYEKAVAEQQAAKQTEQQAAQQSGGAQSVQSATAQTSAQTAAPSFLSQSEAGDKLTEIDGKNLLELLQNPQDVERLTFRAEDGEVLQYDMLWGNVYGGVTYLVVGRHEDTYTKYILYISPEDPSVCYCELNDGVREVIKNDFSAALAGLTQSGGQAAVAKEQEGGRFTRLKRRFITGKPDNPKSKKITFFVMLAIYVAILAVGLSCYFAIKGTGDSALLTRALCIAYALITPSFFIYFGSHNPFGLKNGLCYFLIALGIIGMIVCDVFGFSLISEVGELENNVMSFLVVTVLPISLIVATVCYIIAYVVWCRGLNSGWFLGIGIATTILFPIATALIIAAFLLYIAFIFISWLISGVIILLGGTPMGRGFKEGWTGKSSGGTVYELTDENGYTHTLRHYDGNRYYDGHDFWISDDGGNTFRRDS